MAWRRAGRTPTPSLRTPPQKPPKHSVQATLPPTSTRRRSLPRNSGARAAAMHPASNSWIGGQGQEPRRQGLGGPGPPRKGLEAPPEGGAVPRRVPRLRAAQAGGLPPHVGWRRSPAPSRRRRLRKPRAQGAVGRDPAGRLGPVRSQSPVLTSASCWCVPRRRRTLAGPGQGPAPGPESCNPVAPARQPQRPARVTAARS